MPGTLKRKLINLLTVMSVCGGMMTASLVHAQNAAAQEISSECQAIINVVLRANYVVNDLDTVSGRRAFILTVIDSLDDLELTDQTLMNLRTVAVDRIRNSVAIIDQFLAAEQAGDQDAIAQLEMKMAIDIAGNAQLSDILNNYCF
jgi:hypothetical protein